MRRAALGFVLAGILACGGAREDVEQPATPEPSAAVEFVERPGPEPEIVEQPKPEPPPSIFEPATRGDGLCRVTVSALLEAEEYRGGGPMTPALSDSLAADPDFARMYDAESHGDHHIQCDYQVELGHEPGKRYRWETWFTNTLRDRTIDDCKTMAGEVAEDIIRTTKSCTDLAAGAYWGHTLAPM